MRAKIILSSALALAVVSAAPTGTVESFLRFCSARAFAADTDWKKVDLVFGRSAAVSGAVHRYGLPRSDLKVTLDGVGFDGKPSHTEWTGKYDGKDYPTTGDPNQTSRSYTKIDAHRMKIAVKHGDAVILSGTITVAANGKSRTVEATGGMADKKFSYTAVYDKQ